MGQKLGSNNMHENKEFVLFFKYTRTQHLRRKLCILIPDLYFYNIKISTNIN